MDSRAEACSASLSRPRAARLRKRRDEARRPRPEGDDAGAVRDDLRAVEADPEAVRRVARPVRKARQEDGPAGPLTLSGRQVPLTVFVATSEIPRYVIVISDLTGGRRFLSDDLATLEAIALVVARRIDALRITEERHARELREREMGRLATEAELRALRIQQQQHHLRVCARGGVVQRRPAGAVLPIELRQFRRNCSRVIGPFISNVRIAEHEMRRRMKLKNSRPSSKRRVRNSSFSGPPKRRRMTRIIEN